MTNLKPQYPAPPPPFRRGQVQAFEALYSYKSRRPSELSFEEGDILYVIGESDENWLVAKQNKKQGLIPSSYVSKENVRLPFVDAARRGNLTLLDECLNNGVSVNSLDKTGSSALHAACMSGHLHCVERLLQDPKIEINLQNKLGDTPLHNASIKGHHDICALLLAKGANQDVCNIDKQIPRNLARSSLVIGVFDHHFVQKRGSGMSHLDIENPNENDSDDED